MGLLDDVVGSALGGGAFGGIVSALLQGNGGLPGLVSTLERGGLGDVVQSWVGTGANLPVSPQQLQGAFGPQVLQQLAQHTGMNPQDLVQQLANFLPGVVDNMTPGGTLPRS